MLGRVSNPEALDVRTATALRAAIATEMLTRPMGHRGYWHVVRVLTRALHGTVELDLGPGSVAVDLSDPYWMRLVARGYSYELEVQQWLATPVGDAPDLIDVGANIGFWPAWYGARNPASSVVAVEPNPALTPLLEKNLAALPNPHVAICAAVAPDHSSPTATFHIDPARGRHADASLVHGHAARPTAIDVPVVTIDDILETHRRPGRAVVVKLDIEGMEAPVFESLGEPDDPGVTYIYEDHGRDQSCRPTAWLLANTMRRVFLLAPDAAPAPITSVEDLLDKKASSKVGYNLIAVAAK